MDRILGEEEIRKWLEPMTNVNGSSVHFCTVMASHEMLRKALADATQRAEKAEDTARIQRIAADHAGTLAMLAVNPTALKQELAEASEQLVRLVAERDAARARIAELTELLREVMREGLYTGVARRIDAALASPDAKGDKQVCGKCQHEASLCFCAPQPNAERPSDAVSILHRRYGKPEVETEVETLRAEWVGMEKMWREEFEQVKKLTAENAQLRERAEAENKGRLVEERLKYEALAELDEVRAQLAKRDEGEREENVLWQVWRKKPEDIERYGRAATVRLLTRDQAEEWRLGRKNPGDFETVAISELVLRRVLSGAGEEGSDG